MPAGRKRRGLVVLRAEAGRGEEQEQRAGGADEPWHPEYCPDL
ncbi:MAG: hypothetical protein ACRENC_17515 [Gemmatimonadaceae bacterium]